VVQRVLLHGEAEAEAHDRQVAGLHAAHRVSMGVTDGSSTGTRLLAYISALKQCAAKSQCESCRILPKLSLCLY
jgi:hypothetical protein